MKYARIINNVVNDTFVPQVGFTIEESFTPEVVALYELVPDDVEPEWKRHADGSFSAPTPDVIPVASV
jgi:hypothetical protein